MIKKTYTRIQLIQNSFVYPFLSIEYALKFIYFLLEISSVIISTIRNKLEIIKGTCKEKYQLNLKKLVMKKYENIAENIKEDMIIGTNNIKDSKIINLKIFELSKPRILKTKF